MNGCLDGLTIFRFAHILRRPSSGGVESYLSTLNPLLLQRNRLRILQMYLVEEERELAVETEQVGRGTLVWIPSLLLPDAASRLAGPSRWLGKLKRRLASVPSVRHDLLLSVLSRFEIDLAVFHWISEDSPVVLDSLRRRGVPIAVFNHFQNTRLGRRRIRRQVLGASAYGGVGAFRVPRYARGRYRAAYDGIDASFFDPGLARPLPEQPGKPLILLPARVTGGKGHLDAIRALGRLRRAGVQATLAFAGRAESQALLERIRDLSRRERVGDRVVVAGELEPQVLRDWYAASDLVVLPSREEGLGRVLLEAQSMARPVLAYAVGGVPEAVRDGITGHLVRPGPRSLAGALKRLLADAVRRQAMGARGREWILRSFSPDALAARHEAFYRYACARPD